MVKDMLINYFGFIPGSISLSSSDGNLERLTPAARFKNKLAQLLEGTQAGDVRFLYIDGPGTRHEDGGHDAHWVLLDDGNGEVIDCDWISQTIRAVSIIPSLFVFQIR